MSLHDSDLRVPAELHPRQLWYVPNRRLTTKKAAARAIRIVDTIENDPKRVDQTVTDQELFTAMHTCAFRARRKTRSRHIARADRVEWVARWQTIREYVVKRNLGLGYTMIGRFNSKKRDEDDMLSDALLGLTRAVDRFNPWKGYQFSTYACNVIGRALMRRGKREGHYRQLFPVQFDVTFEKPARSSDPRKELYVERLTQALDRNLGHLTDLESSILYKRFPARRRDRKTFQEIGESVGLSKERVRQIQNIALNKLRKVLRSDPVLK